MEISPMTDTVISSATREVVLGLERPFVMIGERINPTGRKILAAEMAAGNFSRVEADALAQVAAGAHMLDVNAGIPLADEPAILARAVQLVQSITDLPLSIDSSIVKALEAGLAVYRGKPLVNSVTGEEERLEAVLPLVKKYGAAVVAISNDETGISEDPDVRFEVARKIVQRAADHGIPASDIVVDPLVMPIGAINQAGVQVMHLLRRLKNELRVNTTCGASNVSFGLPAREGISATFLTLGTPLLQAARSLGVDVDSVCGGRALCGRCQVLVMEGDFPKHGVSSQAANLSPVSAAEQSFARRRPLPAGHRLSCSAHIQGNLVVDVPASSQVHRQVVRKAADARPITLDPVVHLHYVEVREPDMHDPSGDLQRLLEALHREWEFGPLRCDLAVLQTLQVALRKGQWKVTVAVHAGSQLIGVWPGFHDRIYGLAVDVGSTTIAAHLCNLETGEVVASAGSMNPQIRFGEDLMSRVSYSMMHPGGAQQMTEAVRAALNKLAAEVARDAKVSVSDILELTMVGNPIMHHLLLGIDPVELGGAPFALATDSPLDLRAAELGLTLHPGARVYTLPCIAGHVGADAAAMILAERPDLSDNLTLLVDVGTNAATLLGNRQRLLACSSPTGPA